MSHEKKGQHLVPKCYLKSFISSEVPLQHKNNPFFELGVWVSDKTLSSGWKIKSPKNILLKNRFYNLPNDKPNKPIIEDVLGFFESQYTPIRQKIETQQTLLISDIQLLAIFTMTLYLRVESFQNNFQNLISKIEGFHRQIDNYHSGNEDYSDKIFQNSELIPKNFILNIKFAELILKEGIQFIVNTTPDVFITSDNPVIHSIRHIDEIAALIGENNILDKSINRNEKRPLMLLPITPHVTLISSRFLNEHENFPYIFCSNRDSIFSLNLLSLYNAGASLISSVEKPFGVHEARVADVIQTGEVAPDAKGDRLLIYTNVNRYWIQIRDWERGDNFIKFFTPDLEILEKISLDESLESVHIFTANQRGGMRQIKFGQIDLTGKAPTVIEHTFKFPNS